jgi:predicted peptidase
VPDLVPGETVPFVIALHWAGDINPYFANTSGYLPQLVQPGLEALGALIFAPEVPGASWQDPLSGELVMAFLDLALETWPIDPARVVVTGYSMGGFGTWYLTGRYPDRLSAGIPMASYPVGQSERSVPLYVIHGRADELFNSALVEQSVLELQQLGAPIEWVIVDSLSHYVGFSYVDVLSGAVPWLRDSVWAAPE